MRSGAPLPHARRLRLEAPFELELGGVLRAAEIAYETYGALDAARSNAVLVCHAISGDSHVTRHHHGDAPGWWEAMVGPGRPIDTERHFVICANALGGCRGSTGPASPDPRTGQPYGRAFPELTVGDLVKSQALLCDSLGVERLHAVIGGSLGGHQALDWAARYPERVAHSIPIASSARLSSQAIAFDVIGRNALDGARDPATGLALARMLGHVTYLSRASMARKFDGGPAERRASRDDFEHLFPVGAYLAYQGERFVERFHVESYRALSLAMDRFSLGSSAGEIARALAPATCRWLLVSFTSDWLFPPEQSQEIVHALLECGADVSYLEAASESGHDAFLLAEDIESYGAHVRAFLDPAPAAPTPGSGLESDALAALVPRGARVLAVGAAAELLRALRRRDPARLCAVRESESEVLECLAVAERVIHAKAGDLGLFPAGAFELLVAPDALAREPDLDLWLRGAFRVARRVLVAFENAGHDGHRQRIAKEGRVPAAWLGEPPRRRLSIADLCAWASARGLRVERLLALDSAAGREVQDESNRLADRGIALLSRP